MQNIIVSISGQQGSGKTTLAANLVAWANSNGQRGKDLGLKGDVSLAVHHWKFADPLYDMHEAIRGVLKTHGYEGMKKKDGRLLQLLGTEWGRENLGQNIWADMLHDRIKAVVCLGDIYSKPNFIVVDDNRFPNEMEIFERLRALDRALVLTVRLDCPKEKRKARCDSWRDTDTHPSETALDDYENFDMRIRTDMVDEAGTLELVIRRILSRRLEGSV